MGTTDASLSPPRPPSLAGTGCERDCILALVLCLSSEEVEEDEEEDDDNEDDEEEDEDADSDSVGSLRMGACFPRSR